MNIFAMDIGYNKVKAVNGERQRSFPSVVGSTYQRRFALNNGDGIRLLTPHEVVIGDAAVQYSRFAAPRRDRQWLQTDDYYDLFLAALSELTDSSGQCRVVTGLPVKYYNDKDVLAPRLKQVHSFTRYGRSPQTWNVSEIHILMQPIGTLLRECLDEQGWVHKPNLAKGHIGIIDIGGLTSNFVHSYGLNLVEHECTHEDQGGWSVVAMVREYIEENFPGLNLRDHEIAQAIIDRSLMYEGEPRDLVDVVEESAQALSASLCNVAHSLWSMGKLDVILLTGGGSLLIGEYIRRDIQRAQVVERPVTANVEGYYRYGLFQENKGK